MKSLNEKDYKLFQSLAGLSQEGMRKTLSKYLATRYTKDNVITTKEFIYAVGDIPIGESGGGDDGRVGDFNAVIDLIPLL